MPVAERYVREFAKPILRDPTDGFQKTPPAMEALATITRRRRGERIYTREDPVDHWYRVVSGMARKSTLFADGRRRIVDFLLPGDFFGFTARDERYFDVEAIIDGTVVACYPRSMVETLAAADPMIGRQVREMAYESISRLQARILILGEVTALKKVRAFLIEMVDRSAKSTDGAVVLRMSRYDIADYLALSVETVSRAMTLLQHRGTITLMGKHRVKLSGRLPCA